MVVYPEILENAMEIRNIEGLNLGATVPYILLGPPSNEDFSVES
jgi:hypothetical protein